MILGSLVAVGAPLPEIERKLRSLPLQGISLGSEVVKRHGFDALQLHVRTEETQAAPPLQRRSAACWEGGALPPRVLRRSLAAFELLGRCEAEVHGTSLEKVHFHEVGSPGLDRGHRRHRVGARDPERWKRCHASVIPQGRGFVKAAHGTLPIPAPANGPHPGKGFRCA